MADSRQVYSSSTLKTNSRSLTAVATFADEMKSTTVTSSNLAFSGQLSTCTAGAPVASAKNRVFTFAVTCPNTVTNGHSGDITFTHNNFATERLVDSAPSEDSNSVTVTYGECGRREQQ